MPVSPHLFVCVCLCVLVCERASVHVSGPPCLYLYPCARACVRGCVRVCVIV
jgi:hypothetical protein